MAGRRAPSARPPRRSQHFLRSNALAAQLVRDACVGPDDLVLDLGAGTGRLTAQLARAAGRVRAVEIDPRLAAGLRGRWPNVEVIEGDVTRVGLPREPFRVVANLPFHRTKDVLHHLLDDPRTPLVRADLVVEWGVAFKYGVPWPSNVSGVLWAAFYEATIARRLPRTAFEPPPSVDAGVIVFARRSHPLIAPQHFESYRRFVSGGFRDGLRRVASGPVLRRIAPSGTAARELDAHQWAELFLGRC